MTRYFVGRETIKVLKYAHAQELATTPGEQWGIVKQKHQQEIYAVKQGKFDIIDRRSWAYPYIPESLHRLNQPLLKNTPYNLRRFSETPIPRRAISLIKNAILSLDWKVTATQEALEANGGKVSPETQQRIEAIKRCFKSPNEADSWRTFGDAVLEDLIIGGYGCIEPRITPDYKRPVKMWPVDGSTIRIFADWSEATKDEKPHYAQLTGLKGERGIISFLDDELSYLRLNVRSSTPFGLGMLEIAFNSVNAFLGAQDMSTRAASDQIHKTFLWWSQNVNAGLVSEVRRHIRDDLEGQGKISLIGNIPKPELLDIQAVTPDDLLLPWQEFEIRIIGISFNLSPQNFGLERDVNRNTSEVMSETDWKSAVVPVAVTYREHLNRDIIHKLLGWTDIEIGLIGLDDPDEMTQQKIWETQLKNNLIVPDEVRESMNRPPLPGGWGKLTFMQGTILANAARAMTTPPGGQAGQGPTQPQSQIDPKELEQMDPSEVQQMREEGMLPPEQGTSDAQQPSKPEGILDQMTDQIEELLERTSKEAKKNRPKKLKDSAKMQKEQIQKFKKSEHQQTTQEEMSRDIEKRRSFSLTNRKSKNNPGNNYTGRSR